MVDTIWPVDAVSGAPSYTGRKLRQTMSPLVPMASAARDLGARSGVRPGTPSNTVTASSTTWTCGAFAGCVDLESAAEAGPYLFAFDASATGSVTAANATNPRIDIIYVQLDDPAESDGSTVPAITRKYLAGTAASTPAPPTTPARSMVVAQINVPVSGGGSPSVTWVAPNLDMGIAPVKDLATANAAAWINGQVTWDQAQGVFRHFTGSTHYPAFGAMPFFSVTRDGSKTPSFPNATDTALESVFTWTSATVQGGMSYSGGIVTVPAAGRYAVDAMFSFDVNGTGSRRLFVTKNGGSTSSNPVMFDAQPGNSATYTTVQAHRTVVLAAGDTLRVVVWQDSGGSLAANTPSAAQQAASSFFTVTYLGQ